MLDTLVHAFGLIRRHGAQGTAVIFGAVAIELLWPRVLKRLKGAGPDNWPQAQATTAFTRVFSSQRDWAIFYSYFVGSQRHGGYQRFHARNAEQAQQSAKWFKGKSFMIRYNPVKPQQSTVLEVDNPALKELKA